MTKFRAIASGLLLLTGVLHVYQFFLSPPSRVTTGVTVFGVLYLRLGAWIAAGHQRVLRVGRILPIIGAAAAVSTIFRDGNPLLPWTLPFIAIDAGIVWACSRAVAASTQQQ